MFKRRFRLPSPALVISMVTLSLVLGGTAFAATTATHKDKKADIKLIKKVAPTLSVKHAKTADSATNAGHATSADSATNATNATSATNATNATNSTNLGGHAASFYAPAVLPSGQSESGIYAVSSSSAATGFLFEGITFPTPLAAALDGAHVAWLNGTTTTNCPGVGQAAAGWLCVYAHAASNVTPDNGHPVNTHAGSGGADAYGFMVDFDATGTFAFSYGSWTVTAP